MQTGISTASLFGRFNTEDALSFLNKHKVATAEVFLESFCEYNREFGELLFKRKGETEVHSVHTLTTQFESTLYSLNERAVKDSFYLLDKTKKICWFLIFRGFQPSIYLLLYAKYNH